MGYQRRVHGERASEESTKQDRLLRTMVAHAEEVIWACVKGDNAFLHKTKQGGNKVQFSSEPTNLYNLNTFKFSGLANTKSVGIASGADGAGVTKSRPNNPSKPAAGVYKYTTKRNARKSMASIEKQLDGWRSDLVVAAKARMSVVQKGLRIKKKA